MHPAGHSHYGISLGVLPVAVLVVVIVVEAIAP
jgi:hypothetical protein